MQWSRSRPGAKKSQVMELVREVNDMEVKSVDKKHQLVSWGEKSSVEKIEAPFVRDAVLWVNMTSFF